MKRFVVALAALICATSLHAQTRVSGTIDSQIWTRANSPYLVVGDIRVVKLEIQPGVKVLFNGNYIFEVAGVLKAVGTAQDSIIFTKIDTVSGWRGIFFNFSSAGSELACCRIDQSKNRGIHIDRSFPIIRNCTISNNSVTGFGGGLSVDNGSRISLSNCIITRNSATQNAGGIYIGSNSSVTLNNCIITDNRGSGSSFGGGIFVGFSGSATLVNCIVAFNAPDGIGIQGTTITVKNSILFFNRIQIFLGTNASARVTYSDVQSGYSGEGNINADPLFNDGVKLTLASNSPCVDAGDPDSSFFDVCFPLALGTKRNDIGAYGGRISCNWLKVGVDDINSTLVTQFDLAQNYPNPFNPETSIRYTIPKNDHVTLKVYNLLGREIETLVSKKQTAAEYEIQWNPVGLPSGVYVYRLQVGKLVAIKKLILLK
jgi:parallel beta-helix repeat protein